MRNLWHLALIFLATSICTAQIPNLVGNWTGSETGYFEEGGFYQLSENTGVNLAIAEQKDRLFTGNITYILNGIEVVEGFAGAIGLDNKTFYIAEIKEGYDMGTIISKDEIELLYLADGAKGWASIERLHRITTPFQDVRGFAFA